MTKLDWDFDYDLDCEVAMHNGYRIRAERDDNASNPFEDWDGNWPIAIYYDRSIKVYEKTKGAQIGDPLARFGDALLVICQKQLEKLLERHLNDLRYHLDAWPEDQDPPKWVTDAEALRNWFGEALGEVEDSKLLDVYEELYKLLSIPCYKTTSRGYCQGDWAEVLVVATPEAVNEFMPAGPDNPWNSEREKKLQESLKSTADLYGAWAWGDVYGYVIEKDLNADAPAACVQCDNTLNDGTDVCDQCGGEFEDPEPDWEEIPDGSCWGYYGADHDESGLEDAALEACPEEPVGSPDNILEDA